MNVTKDPVSKKESSSLLFFLPPPPKPRFPSFWSCSVSPSPRPGRALCSGWGRKTRRCRGRRIGSPQRPGTHPARQSTVYIPVWSTVLARRSDSALLWFLYLFIFFNESVVFSSMFARPPRGFVSYRNLLQSCNQRATSFYGLVLKHEKKRMQLNIRNEMQLKFCQSSSRRVSCSKQKKKSVFIPWRWVKWTRQVNGTNRILKTG